jgi:hypothetical protein
MITIHNSGMDFSLTQEQLQHLREAFQQNHFIRLPRILSTELLEEFSLRITNGEWEEKVHDSIGLEVCLSDKGIVALLNFLLNDQSLFRLVEQITGCNKIGSFSGRVYRMAPDSGHYDSWHTDVGEHRLLALSINLGKEPYEGGVLEIRHHRSSSNCTRVPNTGFGDAVLFRLAEGLEHRVTNIEGRVPKTAFAGWFKTQPDFWSSLTTLSSE